MGGKMKHLFPASLIILSLTILGIGRISLAQREQPFTASERAQMAKEQIEAAKRQFDTAVRWRSAERGLLQLVVTDLGDDIEVVLPDAHDLIGRKTQETIAPILDRLVHSIAILHREREIDVHAVTFQACYKPMFMPWRTMAWYDRKGLHVCVPWNVSGYFVNDDAVDQIIKQTMDDS